jgi:hypothetical protein
MKIALVTGGFMVALIGPLYGCSGSSDDDSGDCSEGDEAEGKCDVADDKVPATPCDGTVVDLSGKGHQKVAGRTKDPFSKLVMQTGDSCPTTFSDIMAKLQETDNVGDCKDPESDGVMTRLISETAQASGQAGNFRIVTSRACNRPRHSMLFSAFATATSFSQDVEIISFDSSAGVFNYYDVRDGKIGFFGNSKDLLQGTGEGEIRKCAGCHTGGGLVMKELDTPWLHWEGHFETPGAQQFMMKHHKVLGLRSDGAEFENTVKDGNTAWNKTRIAHLRRLKNVSLQELLKPLFCTVEINLDNGADFDSPVKGGVNDNSLGSVPDDSLLDPALTTGENIPVTAADYTALIKANKQRVEGVTGAIDTLFDYVFVERSHADTDYVAQLQAEKVIDTEFIQDVLMVDFTRPVFSTDRCDLLQFGGELPRDSLTPAKVRNAFIKGLEAAAPAAKTPAATLLANLKTAGQAEADAAHMRKVLAFVAACKALAPKSFMQNALAITSLNRDKARERPIIEFPATMPDDDQNVDPNARLHPETCQLINEFVP